MVLCVLCGLKIKIIENGVREEKINNVKSLIIKAKLSYRPDECYNCNHKFDENSEMLKNTYYLYQELLYSIQHKDIQSFDRLVSSKYIGISPYMQTAIDALFKYGDFVLDALINDASNGRLEVINNLIKIIKRVAFGFRKFTNFRNRILIIHNDFYLKKKYS